MNRFAYEYPNTMASATGESARHSGFSMAAAATSAAADTTTKTHTLARESTPRGSSRPAVRGLRASIAWSARRLNPIAALRAPTIATTIHRSVRQGTRPPPASTAEASANGSAKTECDSLTMRP